MTEEFVIELGRRALLTAMLVGAPLLGLGMVAGLLVSVFQATTQINEQTLAFVPKIAAVLLAVVLFGPWMYGVMMDFTSSLFNSLNAVVR